MAFAASASPATVRLDRFRLIAVLVEGGSRHDRLDRLRRCALCCGVACAERSQHRKLLAARPDASARRERGGHDGRTGAGTGDSTQRHTAHTRKQRRGEQMALRAAPPSLAFLRSKCAPTQCTHRNKHTGTGITQGHTWCRGNSEARLRKRAREDGVFVRVRMDLACCVPLCVLHSPLLRCSSLVSLPLRAATRTALGWHGSGSPLLCALVHESPRLDSTRTTSDALRCERANVHSNAHSTSDRHSLLRTDPLAACMQQEDPSADECSRSSLPVRSRSSLQTLHRCHHTRTKARSLNCRTWRPSTSISIRRWSTDATLSSRERASTSIDR